MGVCCKEYWDVFYFPSWLVWVVHGSVVGLETRVSGRSSTLSNECLLGYAYLLRIGLKWSQSYQFYLSYDSWLLLGPLLVLLLLLLLSSVMSNSVQPHRQQPTRLPCPWDSPGKNTGVGCHVLLQCTKVKSESEVAQLCPTLHDPMDCSLPGSSVHGILQARVLEWGAIAFSLKCY